MQYCFLRLLLLQGILSHTFCILYNQRHKLPLHPYLYPVSCTVPYVSVHMESVRSNVFGHAAIHLPQALHFSLSTTADSVHNMDCIKRTGLSHRYSVTDDIRSYMLFGPPFCIDIHHNTVRNSRDIHNQS